MAPVYVFFLAALCLRQASAQTLGGQCATTTPQCTDANAECVSNTCNCKSGYVASGTVCKAGIGTACSTTVTCNDANAECVTSTNKCACKSGFTLTNGACTAQATTATLGNACSTTITCSDANTECSTTTQKCVCKSGYTQSGTTCTAQSTTTTTATLGNTCSTTITCSDANTECSSTTQKCVCKSGYTQSGSTCTMTNRVQLLNGACSSDSECAVPWSYCNNKKCQCRPKYIKSNDFSCAPFQYFCPVSSWFNDPIKVSGQPLSCISYTITPTAATSTSCAKTRLDNCPVGTYCNVIQASDAVPTGTTRTGICCATPKVMCPTGDAVMTYANGDCTGCPSTHFCFCDALTNMAACCPRSCPSGQQYSNGFCAYSSSSGSSSTSTVTIPSTCTNNNDCFSGATCVNIPNQTSKQCVCSNGLNYVNGQCTSNLCANGSPAMTNGAITTCSASQACTGNYQCDTTRGICCPTSSSSSSTTTTMCTNGNAPISGATCTTAGATCGTAPTTGTCQTPTGSSTLICCA